MGRTLPSITQQFLIEKEAFSRFCRALRKSDQLVLDELFVAAQQHLAEAAYAANALPMEVFLISMLLEEHNEVYRLRDKIEYLYTMIDKKAGGILTFLEKRLKIKEQVSSDTCSFILPYSKVGFIG